MCPQCQNVPTCSIPEDFLTRLNYDIIYQLPCNNDPRKLATQTRICKRLTGEELFKCNVENEAYRLHIYDQCIINLAVKRIWSFTDPSLKNQFTALANDANDINLIINMQVNADNLNRIIRFDVKQNTSNRFEDNFFNGVNFYESNVHNIW